MRHGTECIYIAILAVVTTHLYNFLPVNWSYTHETFPILLSSIPFSVSCDFDYSVSQQCNIYPFVIGLFHLSQWVQESWCCSICQNLLLLRLSNIQSCICHTCLTHLFTLGHLDASVFAIENNAVMNTEYEQLFQLLLSILLHLNPEQPDNKIIVLIFEELPETVFHRAVCLYVLTTSVQGSQLLHNIITITYLCFLW